MKRLRIVYHRDAILLSKYKLGIFANEKRMGVARNSHSLFISKIFVMRLRWHPR